MNKNRIIWGVISILYYLISIQFEDSLPSSDQMNFIIPVFLAITLTFIIFLSINNIGSIKELQEVNDPFLRKISYTLCALLLPYLIYSFSIDLLQSEEQELIEKGVITEAEITSGGFLSQKQGKYEPYNSTSKFLTISFKKKNGHTINVQKSVDLNELQSAYEGKKIHIVYLPNNTSYLEIISTNKDLLKYGKIKAKSLNFPQIEKLIKTYGEYAKLKTLKDYSFGWHLSEENGKTHLINKFTKEALLNIDKKEITYTKDIIKYDFLPKEEIISKEIKDGTILYKTKTIIITTDKSNEINRNYYKFSLIKH